MNLPILQSEVKELTLMQTRWASALNPILTNPLANGILLKNVELISGATVVNHKLGRKLQGWLVTRLRNNVVVFDSQDANPNPALTLVLNSTGATTVDLYVF